MKKSIAYLLTLLTLLITVQPSLAMHFCGDQLRSLSLYGEEQPATACGACSSHKSANLPTLSIEQADCCTNQNIQLTTDSFNSTNPSTDLFEAIQSAVSPVISSFVRLTVPFKELSLLRTIQKEYPPAGLSNQRYNLIHFICTYRL